VSAAALVRRAIDAGIVLRVRGERLLLSGDSRPNEDLLQTLRTEKPAVLAYLRGLALRTEEDWSAFYDERAGIMEFDGGLPRTEAEAKAAEEVEQLRMVVRSSHG